MEETDSKLKKKGGESRNEKSKQVHTLEAPKLRQGLLPSTQYPKVYAQQPRQRHANRNQSMGWIKINHPESRNNEVLVLEDQQHDGSNLMSGTLGGNTSISKLIATQHLKPSQSPPYKKS